MFPFFKTFQNPQPHKFIHHHGSGSQQARFRAKPGGQDIQILYQQGEQLLPEVLQQGFISRSPALATPPPMMKASGTRIYIRFMIRQASISAVFSHNWRATGHPARAASSRCLGVHSFTVLTIPAPAYLLTASAASSLLPMYSSIAPRLPNGPGLP